MQSRVRRLQLRGSGGFTPRFPNIAPAELQFGTLFYSLYLWPPLFIPAVAETKTVCGVMTPDRSSDFMALQIARLRGRNYFDGFRESSSTSLPRPTRIDVNLIGLLACVSSERSGLPSR